MLSESFTGSNSSMGWITLKIPVGTGFPSTHEQLLPERLGSSVIDADLTKPLRSVHARLLSAGKDDCNSERGTMKKFTSLFALLGAGLVTVLAVAGFSTAASDAAPTNQSPPTDRGHDRRSARSLDRELRLVERHHADHVLATSGVAAARTAAAARTSAGAEQVDVHAEERRPRQHAARPRHRARMPTARRRPSRLRPLS